MKICPVGLELSHADGRTEMMKLIVAFRNFAIVLKNGTDVMSLDLLTLYCYFVHANHVILCF